MKSFEFRLERVLQWRTTQLSLEVINTRQAADRLEALLRQKTALAEAAAGMRTSIVRQTGVRGADLAATSAYCGRLNREIASITQEIAVWERELADRQQRTVAARRRLRLLEILRDRKRQEWEQDLNRELEVLAAERALADWTQPA